MDGTQSKPEEESDNWSKNLGAINDRLSSQLSVTSSLLTLAIRVSNIKLILWCIIVSELYDVYK